MEDESYEPVLIQFKDRNVYEWAQELDNTVLQYQGFVPIFGYVESIGFMPFQGKGIAALHRNIGNIEMYMALRKIPIEWVSAAAWQRYFIPRTGKKKFGNVGIERLVKEWEKQGVPKEQIKRMREQKEEEVKEENRKATDLKKFHKGKMKFKAMQLYPNVKVTDNNSQALLIAYAKMKEGKMKVVEQDEEIKI